MDFSTNPTQDALLDALETILGRHAGPDRARALGGSSPAYDSELEERLFDAGYGDVAGNPETGPLTAGLVVEATARAAGVMAIGALALVVPALSLGGLARPVTIAFGPLNRPVRFGADAASLLVVDGDEARVISLGPDDMKRVDSRYGYPMAEMRSGLTGSSLGAGSGPTLAAWSRVALALEMVGTMDGALAVAIEHIRSRRQFGRSIGSFQAVQHRLAEASVLLEGSRWLAREAAFLGAPEEAAATALAQASVATQRVFADVHQLSGAIGFATEHDLHLFSMRLPNLLLEAGSPAAATASLRWAMSGA